MARQKVVALPSREEPKKEVLRESDPAPTWVLTAADAFDIGAMVNMVTAAEMSDFVPRRRVKEMQERLREFELYEERHR